MEILSQLMLDDVAKNIANNNSATISDGMAYELENANVESKKGIINATVDHHVAAASGHLIQSELTPPISFAGCNDVFGRVFDKIFCVNLYRRQDRWYTAKKRHEFIGMKNVEQFCGIDGRVTTPLWKALGNSMFANSAYIGCVLSHLSIYRQAIDSGYDKILIIEDDVRIHRNAQTLLKERVEHTTYPKDWDLLHLSYIPLVDDLSMWNYGILDEVKAEPGCYKSKNLWSLMAYGISSRLMKHILAVYDTSFPMELDRFFVTNIMNMPGFVCRAFYPQLFCAEDNHSDNTNSYTPGLLAKSVDLRYSQYHDYV